MPLLSPRFFISICVSLTVLGVIYWNTDAGKVADVLLAVDGPLFLAAIAMLIPTTLLSAWRFRLLMASRNRPTLAVATKLILAASTLNVVLPSKMGDVLKSIFMSRTLDMRGSLAVSVVIFEKACDLLGLLVWCLLGLVVYGVGDDLFIILALAIGGGLGLGVLMLSSLSFADLCLRLAAKIAPSSLTGKFDNLRRSWADVHGFFWRSRRSVGTITGLTLLIWLLHLIQIWMLAGSLGASVPVLSSLGLSSLAILAGLVPLTMAGIGTRDAATIFLFAPFMTAATGAALGLMLTLRYVLPGLAGLPFLTDYLSMLREKPQ
ncbi:MAG TPA: flippase-like domain-containing protein [Rhodospirillales bacterium]|nr:flippase-like domain-containing protein [Rhodospirillales bacterium]